MGVFRDRVTTPIFDNAYVERLDEGADALQELVRVRQIVVNMHGTIQASSAYTAAEKADAQAEAIALRDAIVAFAGTL